MKDNDKSTATVENQNRVLACPHCGKNVVVDVWVDSAKGNEVQSVRFRGRRVGMEKEPTKNMTTQPSSDKADGASTKRKAKPIASMKKPAWRKDYRIGSTVFKAETVKKYEDDGATKGYRCQLCGDFYPDRLVAYIFELHEIMHILQQMRGHYSNDYFEPMFDGEPENR